MFGHDPRSFRQLDDRPCLCLAHGREQHAPSSLSISLGMVVIESVADVRRNGAELVVWQPWPDVPGKLAGAKIRKLRAGEAEVFQHTPQVPNVEFRVVRDDEIGASQARQKRRRDGGDFRGVQNI